MDIDDTICSDVRRFVRFCTFFCVLILWMWNDSGVIILLKIYTKTTMDVNSNLCPLQRILVTICMGRSRSTAKLPMES